jgi:aryl-alcohol dehydrogenase-like predicted oxidoreductase
MTPPRTRTLGTTGMEITCTGLGAWAMSGTSDNEWGSQDDRDSIATIHRAIEEGINWIDTAPVYGWGHSEQVVGRAIAALPESDRPLIFTKVALERLDHTTRLALPTSEPVDVRDELERSLRHLGLDHVDLYQVHWPPKQPPTPLEEYWQTMVDLRSEGKVRAVGLSNHDVDQLEAAEAIGHVDSLQPYFSAIHRTTVPQIAWCAEHGTGVINFSPQHHGLLSGAFSRERFAALPEGDWRRTDPDFEAGLAAGLALADALLPIAQRHGVSQSAVAIAWTLAWPGITGAIVGARRPEQVDGWIAARDLRLTDEDLDEIADAIARTGAGEGPARPPR